MHHDLSAVWPPAMFKQVDPLPGPQHRFAVGDRDRQMRLGQSGPNVGRHIVTSFRRVEKGTAFRHQLIEKSADVDLHRRVGIFLYDQRSRGVPTKYGQKPHCYAGRANEFHDLIANIVQLLSVGLKNKRMEGLTHVALLRVMASTDHR
jgi:hypothetical protein